MKKNTPVNETSSTDFVNLYEQHTEYSARRKSGSFEQLQVQLEATEFKIPNLVNVLPPGVVLSSAIEIGCATGELIANFPVTNNGRRTGCDISPANIKSAIQRYPNVDFFTGDFSEISNRNFGGVILSDVLEHVENDVDFLKRASLLGTFTLINLPLEDNWLNSRRKYGPSDVSGHLRRYSLLQGLELISKAGLKIVNYNQVWIHETAVEIKRRNLRELHYSSAFNGGPLTRTLKNCVMTIARNIKPFGQRLLASNLFAMAVKNSE